MRWAGHIANIREMRKSYKILVEDLEGREHLEDVGVDARIIL
jgi:hypothetical protein